MDAKILRKWGLKVTEATESKDSLPGSPTSILSSQSTPVPTPVDYMALRAWLPPIPHFERQKLSPTTLHDLRAACAVVLKETTPEDADLDQTDPLEEYHKALQRVDKSTARKPVEARGERPKPSQQSEVLVQQYKQRTDSPRISGKHKPYKTATEPVMGTASSARRAEFAHPQNFAAFPQPPRRADTHTAVSTHQHTENYRPRQQSVPSQEFFAQEANYSPRQISRITTAYAVQVPQPASQPHGQSHPQPMPYAQAQIPTGRSSLSNPPQEAGHASRHRASSGMSGETKLPHNARISHESSQAQKGSQSWANQGMNASSGGSGGSGGAAGRQQEEEIQVLPELHQVSSRQSSRVASGLRSRAESVRNNIREYIRPGSRTASRPGTSHSNHAPQLTSDLSGAEPYARPDSRASVASTGHNRSWWRGAAGALRRKGSFTSFGSRNSSVTNLHEPISPVRDPASAPDLDKSLPPMPSLDSWVEPKVHISQLMLPQMPSPPQNSLTSPVDASSPVEARSPPTIQSSMSHTMPQPYQTNFAAMNGPHRSNRSPALTPASDNIARKQRPLSRAKASTFPVESDLHDAKRPVNGHSAATEQGVRTFRSPAHQMASSDMAQFSDKWRAQLLQKDDERRRQQEVDWARKKQERKRLEAERKKVGNGKQSRDKMPGIKNRLSKMFGGGGGGAAAAVRASPGRMPTTTEDPDIDVNGRDRTHEVTVAH